MLEIYNFGSDCYQTKMQRFPPKNYLNGREFRNAGKSALPISGYFTVHYTSFVLFLFLKVFRMFYGYVLSQILLLIKTEVKLQPGEIHNPKTQILVKITEIKKQNYSIVIWRSKGVRRQLSFHRIRQYRKKCLHLHTHIQHHQHYLDTISFSISN